MKRLLAAFLVMLAGTGLILVGCESLNEPESAVETSESLEDSFDIATLESEASLLKSAGVTADSANAFFKLRWSESHRYLHDGDSLRGHASAVAYEEVTVPRDFEATGLDMGSVSVLTGLGTFELEKMISSISGVRYGLFGFHKGGRGGHGGRGGPRGGNGCTKGDSLAIINIPFIAGGNYQFNVTGSDSFPAMTLDITAPLQLVQITGHADRDTIDATQDLTITWEGDATANHMVLVLAPAFKRGRLDSSVEPVYQALEAAAGSYTISAQTLQDLVSQSGANAVSVRLSQGNYSEIADATVGKIIVSAGTDDRVVLIVQ